jgi:hypothetical protein
MEAFCWGMTDRIDRKINSIFLHPENYFNPSIIFDKIFGTIRKPFGSTMSVIAMPKLCTLRVLRGIFFQQGIEKQIR